MIVSFMLTGAYLLAVCQGLALFVLLLRRGTERSANRVLAVLIALVTLYLAGLSFFTTRLMTTMPYILGLRYPLLFCLGPLLFLYTGLMVGRPIWNWRQWCYQLLPLAGILTINLPLITASLADKQAFVESVVFNAPPIFSRGWLTLMLGSLGWLHLAGYCLAALSLLRRHNQRIREEFSTLSRVDLHWLRVLAGVCLATGVCGFTLSLVTLLLGFPPQNPVSQSLGILLVLLIYIVGYFGLLQPKIFTGNQPISAEPAENPPITDTARKAPNAVASKYEKSSLTDSASEACQQQLLELMARDHPYLDCELNLSQLAELLDVAPHHLSQVINAELGVNFFEFINNYRVEYAKKCLINPAQANDKILDIALAAGFNNKSTFYQAFKKSTDLTPSQYRKLHAQINH